MKKIFLSIAVALAALTVQAQNLQTILSGGTNFIAANSTATYPSAPLIAVNGGGSVALQTQFRLVSGNGITNVLFRFDLSIDGTFWHSNAITWGVPATAAVTNSITTNINVGAWGFMRLNTSTNGNDTAVTNLILKASQKKGLP